MPPNNIASIQTCPVPEKDMLTGANSREVESLADLGTQASVGCHGQNLIHYRRAKVKRAMLRGCLCTHRSEKSRISQDQSCRQIIREQLNLQALVLGPECLQPSS